MYFDFSDDQEIQPPVDSLVLVYVYAYVYVYMYIYKDTSNLEVSKELCLRRGDSGRLNRGEEWGDH